MEKTVSGDMMNDNSNSNSSTNPKVSSSSSSCNRNAQATRRRKLELGRAKDVAGGEDDSNGCKRRKMQMFHDDGKAVGGVETGEVSQKTEAKLEDRKNSVSSDKCPRFGVASICGRRRDMEDFVSIHPSLCSKVKGDVSEFHYFAVYDGHGCCHVAKRCMERLHELVKEELGGKEVGESVEWKEAMEKSFGRMDEEVIRCKETVMKAAGCRCLLPSRELDAVGSTAVVALVTPHKIVVANCGDSRAVLARKGKISPLSVDHKPDRPDELSRIQAAGGRVIHWDGSARVLGVLAMSRAIGDSYLKPYVISQPEVTIIGRTEEDECLILASDGLWDMVSNQTACCVARMCLDGKVARMMPPGKTSGEVGEYHDQACAEASLLLTKLALVRRSSDNVSVVVINLRMET